MEDKKGKNIEQTAAYNGDIKQMTDPLTCEFCGFVLNDSVYERKEAEFKWITHRLIEHGGTFTAPDGYIFGDEAVRRSKDIEA